ncbi:MAG: ankyrin repeat domain-containing protein [Planctomycetota bacterium]|nr:ankyrin repeat domain-containing protein [Planctomycetota bacterium]
MGEDTPQAPVNPLWARLLAAVEKGNIEAVRQLVAQDKDLVNAHTPEGQSAVEAAAESVSWERPNCFRIAQYLVESGARCDVFAAARAGLLDHLKKLLDAAPGLLNAQDGLGRTPLQRAALAPGSCKECEAVVEYLLDRGADMDIFTACTLGRPDAVQRRLSQDRRLVHARCQGGTPLLWAVRPRHSSPAVMEIVALLLENRADLNAEDAMERGMTVLHHAVAWGNSRDVVGFLMDRGAELNAKDDNGWTPLDHAIERGHRELAALLRSRGAKETAGRAGGKFAAKARELIAAAQKGDVQIVAALLAEEPGLVHARGTCGETTGQAPLHCCARAGDNAEVAEFLLAHGAATQVRDNSGKTALAYAYELGHGFVADVLRRKKAKEG